MFICFVNYIKPLDLESPEVVAHRSYMADLYAEGVVVASGQRVPWTGGVTILRAANANEARTILARGPLAEAGLTSYELVQFEPRVGS